VITKLSQFTVSTQVLSPLADAVATAVPSHVKVGPAVLMVPLAGDAERERGAKRARAAKITPVRKNNVLVVARAVTVK
jgi:hypothetical protein